jgi:hypothetical protein
MGYNISKQKSKSDSELYEYISTKKRWKKEWGGITPTQEQIRKIAECLRKLEVLGEGSITRLARLIRYGNDNDIEVYWYDECLIMKGERKRGYGSASLECFQKSYGDEEGKRRYEQHCNEVIKPNARTSSPRCVEYYIKRGFTETQAEQKVKDHNAKVSKVRWDKVKESGVNLSEYAKSINPLSKSFQGYVGMDKEESEAIRKRHLEKCIRGKDFYIRKYGQSEGAKRFEDRMQRRKETMLKNGTGTFNVKKGCASGWSLKLLLPICEWLHSLGYSKKDIQMGLPEYRGERWIRHGKNEYFMYDFCFVPGNILIEYHGVKWHPKPNGEFLEGSPLGLDGKLARQRDEAKVKLAESHGYKIIEIWSDEDLNESIERCKQFIREHGLPKV